MRKAAKVRHQTDDLFAPPPDHIRLRDMPACPICGSKTAAVIRLEFGGPTYCWEHQPQGPDRGVTAGEVAQDALP